MSKQQIGLKAQLNSAQGNALGRLIQNSLRPEWAAQLNAFLSCPFRAQTPVGKHPRALPWGELSWAFSPDRVWISYFFLLLLLLGAAAGCTPTDDTLQPADTNALTFRTTLEGLSIEPATRAVSGDVDLAGLGFTVVGYHTNESFPLSDAAKAALVPNIFDKIADAAKTPVRKVNAGINFRLPLAKIPLDDLESSVRTHFSFFAWSAAVNKNAAGTAVDVIKAATATTTDKGYPFIDIELPAPDAQAQGDVAVAHSLNAPNDYVVTAVDLDFHHVFSKLSFQAKATSGAVVKVISTKLRYAAGSVYTKARYEFNASDSVGSWKSFTAPQAAGDVTPYGFNAPSLTTTSAYLGSMLMIPQSCKTSALSLVVNYTVTLDGKVSEIITRTVPIVLDMRQGKHYTYMLNIETERMEVINLSVGGWKDAGKVNPMPIIPGPMGDVLLLLEGYDKPYKHSDGKWYWLDRSGYNRHCEIVGYADGMYSESDRSYEFVRNRTLAVPPFGNVEALTMDIVAQETTNNGNQNVVIFSSQGTSTDPGYRQFFAHLGWPESSQYMAVLDTEGMAVSPARLRIVLSGTNFFKNKIMWTLQKKDNEASSIYHNALLLGTNTTWGTGKLGSLNYNVIARDYGGKISHVKITSKKQTVGEISKDFASVMQRYKIDKIKGTYLPATESTKDALFACWDARSGLLDYNGGNGDGSIWVDQAGEGLYMTAHVPAGINGSFKYNKDEKAIVSVSPVYPYAGIYMTNETKFDAELKEITFETVSESIGAHLNYFMVIMDDKGNRLLTVRPNTGNDSHVELAVPNIYPIYFSDLISVATSQNVKRSLVYTFNLKTGTIRIYQNGVQILSKTTTQTPLMNSFKIGRMILLNAETAGNNQAFTGNVYAYRMYNRELTAAEILANYTVDKVTFGLP